MNFVALLLDCIISIFVGLTHTTELTFPLCCFIIYGMWDLLGRRFAGAVVFWKGPHAASPKWVNILALRTHQNDPNISSEWRTAHDDNDCLTILWFCEPSEIESHSKQVHSTL